MKYIIALLICLQSLIAVAQQKFETYKISGTDGVYEINIKPEQNRRYELYIDMYSLDKAYAKAGIKVDKLEHERLIASLMKCNDKYKELKKAAIKNKKEEVSEKIDVTCDVGGYFKNVDWQFAGYTPLSFTFKAFRENGIMNYWLVARTGRMISNTNRLKSADGAMIVFTSEEEIASFLNKIDKTKIKEFLAELRKKDQGSRQSVRN